MDDQGLGIYRPTRYRYG